MAANHRRHALNQLASLVNVHSARTNWQTRTGKMTAVVALGMGSR